MSQPVTNDAASSRERRDARHHEIDDPHVRGRWLSDLVLGAQDGLVNSLGVILGVAAATGAPRIVVATGLAAAVAEALSMAAVAYTSEMARGDLYRAERDREYRHIESVPDIEREEIRALYAKKGFRGDLLDRVVDAICANKDVWVAVMMAEEHALIEIDRGSSLRSAGIVGIAALAGAALPVAPYAIFSRPTTATAAALALGALLLWVLGAFKSRVTTGRPVRGGLSLAVIGVLSAVAGYAVGALFAP
jgi:VIT1/CCC1 family predicted Fe2+/Mn2+ transporter